MGSIRDQKKYNFIYCSFCKEYELYESTIVCSKCSRDCLELFSQVFEITPGRAGQANPLVIIDEKNNLQAGDSRNSR